MSIKIADERNLQVGRMESHFLLAQKPELKESISQKTNVNSLLTNYRKKSSVARAIFWKMFDAKSSYAFSVGHLLVLRKGATGMVGLFFA